MGKISLEQYLGSAQAYIMKHAVAGTKAYYNKVPEGFLIPSVFFPVPWTTTTKAMIGNAFTKRVHFECDFFDRDAWAANADAELVQDALQADRCIIPVLEKDGSPVGYGFHISDLRVQQNDDGDVSMQFIFDHTTETEREKGPAVQGISLNQQKKGG